MPGRFRTNVDRVQKYEVKTRTDRVKQIGDDVRQAALVRHSAKQAELANFELQAKEAIDGLGVSSPLYVAYLNYCREIWKKWNTYGGGVLKKETEAIIAKWAARDLDPTLLRKLRKDLISVT
jgi:hypothetical protein